MKPQTDGLIFSLTDDPAFLLKTEFLIKNDTTPKRQHGGQHGGRHLEVREKVTE